MKNYFHQTAAVGICLLAFLLVLGWAGDVDFTDQIILSMSQEEYDTVKNHLTDKNGHEPSESEIAHWWVENRD